MHNNQNNHIKRRHEVEKRRRQTATLLAQSRTETEIAAMLGVDQGTVSRDIKALKELAKQFLFDLAKSDLAYFYRTCIDGIEAVKRRAWNVADRPGGVDDKVLIAALKLCKECDVARFELFQSGPNVLNLDKLQDRINIIEKGNGIIHSYKNQEAVRTS